MYYYLELYHEENIMQKVSLTDNIDELRSDLGRKRRRIRGDFTAEVPS